MKVKNILPITILSMSIIPILAIFIFSYSLNENVSKQNYDRLLNNQLDASLTQITSFFENESNSITEVSKSSLYSSVLKNTSIDPKQLSTETLHEAVNEISKFQQTLKKYNPYMDESYLLSLDGYIVSSSNPSYIGTSFTDKEFFKKALSSTGSINKIAINSSGERIILMGVPAIDDNNNKLGVLIREINCNYINAYIKQLTVGETGYVYILDEDGTILCSPFSYDTTSPENIEMTTPDLNKLMESFRLTSIDYERHTVNYDIRGESIRSFYQKNPNSNLIVVSAITQKEIDSLSDQHNLILGIIALTTIIISSFAGLIAMRKITAPIHYLDDKIQKIADGDLKQVCEYNGFIEFEDLSKNINIMTASMYANQKLLSESALTDALTTLPNRKSIYISMEKHFGTHELQASLLLDLDGFKNVNDTLGHDYGDLVLKSVAKILIAKGTDYIYPSRLGGDEFFIFIDKVTNKDDVFKLGNQLIEEICNITSLNGKDINISASVGIGFKEEEDTNYNVLIKKADLAMYHIKKNGKKGCIEYNPTMGELTHY